MLAALKRSVTSRAAGPTASLVALALAVLLAGTWASGRAERAALEAEIAELTQASDKSAAMWKAQLGACQAAAAEAEARAAAARQATLAAHAVEPKDAAQRLLAQQPEGIDVCARMESADQAVLATLR